jgi:hypothetical protein
MTEAEGIDSLGPGRFQKTSWSKGRELHIRNVEAEGSNPFTSTKRPRSEGQGGIPRSSRSTAEFYVRRRRARRCELAGFTKGPAHGPIA